jgi:hypothetical protein
MSDSTIYTTDYQSVWTYANRYNANGAAPIWGAPNPKTPLERHHAAYYLWDCVRHNRYRAMRTAKASTALSWTAEGKPCSALGSSTGRNG